MMDSVRSGRLRLLAGTLLLLTLAGVAPTAAQGPVGRVTGLRLEPAAGAAELLIRMDGAASQWTDFALDNPARVVVDIPGARNALPAARFDDLQRAGVLGVRASQFGPDVVRVVLELDRARAYSVERDPAGLRIRLPGEDVAFAPWSSDAAPARPSPPVRAASRAQEQPRISVSFQETDIRDVLSTFAEFTDRSIVPGSGVSGAVTATIRNQPWDVALQTILRAYGLAAEEMPSGIIQVDAIERLAERQTQEALVTEQFRVNYVPAAELSGTVETLLSERGKVSVNPTTNTLVITDVERVLGAVRQMVGGLDVRTPQVSIQAKIIFVNRTDVEELGVTYDLRDSQGNAFTRLVTDPRAPDLEQGETLVNLGGNSLAALGNANVRVQGPQLEIVSSLVLGRFTLLTFLDALQSAELSDVQAAPLITTLDNQEAEIWVGERTPIRVVDVGAGGAAGGGAGLAVPRATAELVETGIRLRVTPHITADRRILMDLHAERSSAQLAATDIGVIFQQQQGRTRLMVRDGETAVIGGLTVTESAVTRSGIPYLMDLPIVGRLFRTDREREQKRDLLIMVTPRIIDDRA